MDVEKNTFLLCFLTIIWRRIFCCLLLYCEHNRIPPTSNSLLKCLKYNLLSPTGIVRKIKPYLKKAFIQGFLMPKEFEKSKYVKKGIKLFGEAYKISKIEDPEIKNKEEIKFIYTYALRAFSDDNPYIFENEQESIDSMKDLLVDPKYRIDKHCYFCELIEAWDIEIGLVRYKDSYDELVTSSLLYTLEKSRKIDKEIKLNDK